MLIPHLNGRRHLRNPRHAWNMVGVRIAELDMKVKLYHVSPYRTLSLSIHYWTSSINKYLQKPCACRGSSKVKLLSKRIEPHLSLFGYTKRKRVQNNIIYVQKKRAIHIYIYILMGHIQIRDSFFLANTNPRLHLEKDHEK